MFWPYLFVVMMLVLSLIDKVEKASGKKFTAAKRHMARRNLPIKTMR